MCGILAAIGWQGASPLPRGWNEAMAALTPRGPDAHGHWTSPSRIASLGHTRLAINDLSTAGDQPMLGQRGTLGVCFNGEIYNAPELRDHLRLAGHAFQSHCDTEVIVHGYAEWGFDELLSRLRGMYAIAIWNDQTRTLHAAVDPVGMKPLAFACDTGALYLASTCDALRHVLPTPPALDRAALCDVLCLGYIPAPHTVWQGVSKLGPGEALEWRPAETPRRYRHYEPPRALNDHTDPNVFPQYWEQVLDEHLLSDVPVGLFLSGGIDSSAIAVALAARGRPVSATTLALHGDDNEAPAAASLAAHIGMPHRSVAIADLDLNDILRLTALAFDEPQAYGALLTATCVAREGRKSAKVMLGGDGGDELFAGYTWHTPPTTPHDPSAASQHDQLSKAVHAPHADAASRHDALASLASLSPLHTHLQRVFPRFHPAEASALFGADYDEARYCQPARPHDEPSLPWPRRAQRLDLMTFCAGSIMPKIDRAAMSVGLEVRAPLLDRRLVDWALSLPLARAPEPKSVLRSYLAPRVPSDVLTRPKQGFSLRLPRDHTWQSYSPFITESRLISDSVLCPEWQSYLAADAPYANARWFALTMLAAWYEERA